MKAIKEHQSLDRIDRFLLIEPGDVGKTFCASAIIANYGSPQEEELELEVSAENPNPLPVVRGQTILEAVRGLQTWLVSNPNLDNPYTCARCGSHELDTLAMYYIGGKGYQLLCRPGYGCDRTPAQEVKHENAG